MRQVELIRLFEFVSSKIYLEPSLWTSMNQLFLPCGISEQFVHSSRGEIVLNLWSNLNTGSLGSGDSLIIVCQSSYSCDRTLIYSVSRFVKTAKGYGVPLPQCKCAVVLYLVMLPTLLELLASSSLFRWGQDVVLCQAVVELSRENIWATKELRPQFISKVLRHFKMEIPVQFGV